MQNFVVYARNFHRLYLISPPRPSEQLVSLNLPKIATQCAINYFESINWTCGCNLFHSVTAPLPAHVPGQQRFRHGVVRYPLRHRTVVASLLALRGACLPDTGEKMLQK